MPLFKSCMNTVRFIPIVDFKPKLNSEMEFQRKGNSMLTIYIKKFLWKKIANGLMWYSNMIRFFTFSLIKTAKLEGGVFKCSFLAESLFHLSKCLEVEQYCSREHILSILSDLAPWNSLFLSSQSCLLCSNQFWMHRIYK